MGHPSLLFFELPGVQGASRTFLLNHPIARAPEFAQTSYLIDHCRSFNFSCFTKRADISATSRLHNDNACPCQSLPLASCCSRAILLDQTFKYTYIFKLRSLHDIYRPAIPAGMGSSPAMAKGFLHVPGAEQCGLSNQSSQITLNHANHAVCALFRPDPPSTG